MRDVDPLRVPVQAALALSVLAASAAVFAEVICRYVLNDPSAWLDEFAVLAFAWMIMIGAAAVQRDDAHMQIDTFVRPLPARAQAAIYLLRFVGIAFTLVVVAWQGFFLMRRMSFVEYPAMEISRGFLFAILPVCMPLVLYYLIRTAIADWRVIRSGGKVFDKAQTTEVL
jgi:TRAP-type C4-dicarboxylate transport system permease small subunit